MRWQKAANIKEKKTKRNEIILSILKANKNGKKCSKKVIRKKDGL
jgi:predicted transcriptional regulator